MENSDHETRIAAIESAVGQLAHSDQLHTLNHKELAERFRAAGRLIEARDKEIAKLEFILAKESEQLSVVVDVLNAQRVQIEKLNSVVDRHHKFLEKLFEQSPGELPPLGTVN
jgi:hypothetical protein